MPKSPAPGLPSRPRGRAPQELERMVQELQSKAAASEGAEDHNASGPARAADTAPPGPLDCSGNSWTDAAL